MCITRPGSRKTHGKLHMEQCEAVALDLIGHTVTFLLFQIMPMFVVTIHHYNCGCIYLYYGKISVHFRVIFCLQNTLALRN